MADEAPPGPEPPNPVPIILGVTVTVVLIFLVGNVLLWYYAQQNAPPRPKKKLGAKKTKREALKRGLAPAGE
jgi:hypothetical protein